MVTVRVDVRPLTANRLHNEWPLQRAARRRRERQAVRAAFAGVELPPGPPYLVTFVRVGPQLADDDAVPFALKTVRDEVAAILHVGDGPRDTEAVWAYRQRVERVPCVIVERGRRRKGFAVWCEVRVESLPSGPLASAREASEGVGAPPGTDASEGR